MLDDKRAVAQAIVSLAGPPMLPAWCERLSSVRRVDTLDRHRSISGMASDICSIARLGDPEDRELEEGAGFEDNRDTSSKDSHHLSKNMMD